MIPKYILFLLFLISIRVNANEADICNIKETELQLQKMLKEDKEVRATFEVNRVAATAKGKAVSEQELSTFRIAATAVDTKNQAQLDQIVTNCGWPTAKVFVNSGLQAAFMIVQHADLAYQLKYFPLIEKSHQQNQIPSFFFVILEDRLLIRQGKPQKYGTQYFFDKNGVSTLVLPIDDPDGLNERRTKIGLSVIPGYP
jgi:hypothetical protein